ncbi:MAG: type II secretion system minor pseudopilin GspH [bacterium]|nr:type II secretion system protein GspH [Gammaproteobacteria bacterium]HIL95971.1 type II secretion system protein GspH [Pseudomonadales bacterium]
MIPHLSDQSRTASAGFTLVEILVVLLIVSIMSGIALANLPGFTQTRDFDTEARRLKTLLDMAREESVIQAAELGFAPTEDGYGFQVYDEFNQKWLEYEQSPFQQRSLPDNVELELEVENQDFTLTAETKSTIPPLLILSSGEITPFTLTLLQGSELQRSMRSDGYGDIEWLEDE